DKTCNPLLPIKIYFFQEYQTNQNPRNPHQNLFQVGWNSQDAIHYDVLNRFPKSHNSIQSHLHPDAKQFSPDLHRKFSTENYQDSPQNEKAKPKPDENRAYIQTHAIFSYPPAYWRPVKLDAHHVYSQHLNPLILKT